MHLALNKTQICNASSSQLISNGNNKCSQCIKTPEHTPEGTEFWTEKLPSKYLCANQLHVSQTCQLHPHSILNKQEPEKDVSKSWNILSKKKSWNTSFNNENKDLQQTNYEWPTELKSITDLHMAKKEMTYLYGLAEFLLVSDLQTSADSINWWRIHDTDIGTDQLNENKIKPQQMTLPESHTLQLPYYYKIRRHHSCSAL